MIRARTTFLASLNRGPPTKFISTGPTVNLQKFRRWNSDFTKGAPLTQQAVSIEDLEIMKEARIGAGASSFHCVLCSNLGSENEGHIKEIL
jgi:hypothetical protein